MEASGETANFAILDEDMAVYLGQVESRRAICKVGGRVFLHSSALGKSMLALMHREHAREDRDRTSPGTQGRICD
jgi:IclR family transcriptional regulator, acetate operon repressor